MARDPSGMTDGPNLYAYIGNRPTYAYDPWGLALIAATTSAATADQYHVLLLPDYLANALTAPTMGPNYIDSLNPDYNLFNIESDDLEAILAAIAPGYMDRFSFGHDASDFQESAEMGTTFQNEVGKEILWGAVSPYGLKFAGKAAKPLKKRITKAQARWLLKLRYFKFSSDLVKLAGPKPLGTHAHHVLPVEFEEKFLKQYGINIWDAKYGAWWSETKNLGLAREYNDLWRKFLRDAPTLEEVLQFGRDLGRQLGFKTMF